MVPWAGRIRRGLFDFDGSSYRLPANLDEHAAHGVGFALPWQIESRGPAFVELSLALPGDERWPFGGLASQRIEVANGMLRLQLSVTAGTHAMPVVLGWHPWFRKPDRLEFAPHSGYPRDAEGIAILPTRQPPPGPGTTASSMKSRSSSIAVRSDCD